MDVKVDRPESIASEKPIFHLLRYSHANTSMHGITKQVTNIHPMTRSASDSCHWLSVLTLVVYSSTFSPVMRLSLHHHQNQFTFATQIKYYSHTYISPSHEE